MNSHGKSWTALLLPAMFLGMAIPSAAQSQFPDGKGKEIVEMVCSQCHGLNHVSDSRRTQEEWESVVSDMVARGAPLLVDEIDTVSEYLVKNFGPQSPPELLPRKLLVQARQPRCRKAREKRLSRRYARSATV